MSTKIFQKHVIKGTREFEIIEDEINYKIKTPLGKEELSVAFSALNPEPVVSGSTLSFLSRVNGEALLELFLDKPDKESFDEFISTLKEHILEEDFGRFSIRKNPVKVHAKQIGTTIDMLKTYVDPDEIKELLTALAELQESPDDNDCLQNLADVFNNLGFIQTSVLTYAPYINSILSGMNEDESHAEQYR